MIDEKLMEILVCPVTKQKLRIEKADQLRLLNQMIICGQIKNVSGEVLTHPAEGLLVREDGQVGYGIIDGIPNMLAEEAIMLPQR